MNAIIDGVNKTIHYLLDVHPLYFAWLIGAAIFAVICACLALMNNTIRTPPEPLKYEVIEFSVCKGWNDKGEAAKQDIFLPKGQSIFACGQLRTNHPVTLSVDWSYEGKIIYVDVIHGVENRFLSELTSTQTEFAEGNYETELVMGKKTERSVKFKIAP